MIRFFFVFCVEYETGVVQLERNTKKSMKKKTDIQRNSNNEERRLQIELSYGIAFNSTEQYVPETFEIETYSKWEKNTT